MLASFRTGLVMENTLLSTRLPHVGTFLTVNIATEEGSTFAYNRVRMQICSVYHNFHRGQYVTITVRLHYMGFNDVRGQLWYTTEGQWVLGVDNNHLAELELFKRRGRAA